MAETPTTLLGSLRAKIVALVSTAAGLLSGAVLMYVSPLVDHFVKPGAPIANFGVDKDGLKITVHNQSTGGHEGWWDFGDGSSLEPFDPEKTTLTHTYAGGGQYPVKLSLKSVFGEVHERTANVQLDAGTASAPQIAAFDAAPLHKHAFAPATFRLVSQVANADTCIWSYGDREPEVFGQSANPSERLVTFKQPGTYAVKLIALSGKKAAEATKFVVVQERPKNQAMVQLTVTDELTRVDRQSPLKYVHLDFPPQTQGNAYSFDRVLQAAKGFQIVDQKIVDAGEKQGVQNLRVEVAPDRQSAKVTGQLVKQAAIVGKTQQYPHAVVKVQLAEQRQVVAQPTPTPIAAELAVPGTTVVALPPTPANATIKSRKLSLEVILGDQHLVQGADLPHNRTVMLQGRPYQLNAAIVGNQVRIDVADGQSGVQPAGFQVPPPPR
jgi:PKD repeat protein